MLKRGIDRPFPGNPNCERRFRHALIRAASCAPAVLHGLHAGQLHRVPPVVGEESQPEGRDEEMVDLVLGVHGAGAGDDVVAPGQRLGSDKLQQQP